jgi:hypothetical protein
MRSCVGGREGDLIVVLISRQAPKKCRSMDERDCGARTCAEDNYSRAGHN